jgi:DNA-directed RNA polymerase sigma subunit (sigma70/sigma32)
MKLTSKAITGSLQGISCDLDYMRKHLTLEERVFNRRLKSEALRDEFEIRCIYLIENKWPRSALVICMRLGYDGRGFKTLKQVAKEFNISPPRIRVLEYIGVKTLLDRKRFIEKYLGDQL